MTNRLHLLKQPYRDIAERWVSALRSGEYRQGAGCLHTEDGKYCCLGVLQGPIIGMDVSASSNLCMAALAHSGVLHPSGMLKRLPTLAELNDAEKWTFPQIADLIESVPVGLWRDECFESGRQPEDNSDG